MCKRKGKSVLFAPLYIHHFTMLQPHFLSEAEKFNLRYTSPSTITYTGDKIRYYRYAKGLLQRDVANYAGLDRGTYSKYERDEIYYPRDKIEKIAQLLDVEVHELLDDYNRFIYDGQGQNIKAIRRSLGYTQYEFAKLFVVSTGAVKRWEQNRVHIQRSTFLKLISLKNGQEKNVVTES